MAIKGITTVRNLVSGGVALIAAWSSYSHMVHLAVIRSLWAARWVDLGFYVVDMSVTGREMRLFGRVGSRLASA